MNDDDFREATITLLPPGDGQQSDEDSGDEEQSEFHQLSRNQLLAEADLCVDYGSHIVSTLADDVEVAVMQQPRRSSRLRASDPDEESELDVSADLWGNGDGEDPGLPLVRRSQANQAKSGEMKISGKVRRSQAE